MVRIDKDVKERSTRLVRMEGKSLSEKIREMVDEYVEENDFAAAVDSVWERVSQKIKRKGYAEEDVERVIGEVRASK